MSNVLDLMPCSPPESPEESRRRMKRERETEAEEKAKAKTETEADRAEEKSSKARIVSAFPVECSNPTHSTKKLVVIRVWSDGMMRCSMAPYCKVKGKKGCLLAR